MMIPKKLFWMVLLICFSGCTTYHGLEAIKPDRRDGTSETKPHFQWQPSSKQGVKYDFVIFEASMKKAAPMPGKTVYYREGLDTPEHTLEADLKSGQDYLWSARVRDGGTVGQWSRYDYFLFYGLGFVSQKNYWYLLRVH